MMEKGPLETGYNLKCMKGSPVESLLLRRVGVGGWQRAYK